MNAAVGLIPAADVPTVQPAEGQILSLTVPALDLNLLGLKLETSPITVNANAQEGDGKLLGNVLTSLLGTLDATPDKVAQLNNTLNGVLARVVGVLNAADLTVASVAGRRAAAGAADAARPRCWSRRPGRRPRSSTW